MWSCLHWCPKIVTKHWQVSALHKLFRELFCRRPHKRQALGSAASTSGRLYIVAQASRVMSRANMLSHATMCSTNLIQNEYFCFDTNLVNKRGRAIESLRVFLNYVAIRSSNSRHDANTLHAFIGLIGANDSTERRWKAEIASWQLDWKNLGHVLHNTFNVL